MRQRGTGRSLVAWRGVIMDGETSISVACIFTRTRLLCSQLHRHYDTYRYVCTYVQQNSAKTRKLHPVWLHCTTVSCTAVVCVAWATAVSSEPKLDCFGGSDAAATAQKSLIFAATALGSIRSKTTNKEGRYLFAILVELYRSVPCVLSLSSYEVLHCSGEQLLLNAFDREFSTFVYKNELYSSSWVSSTISYHACPKLYLREPYTHYCSTTIFPLLYYCLNVIMTAKRSELVYPSTNRSQHKEKVLQQLRYYFTTVTGELQNYETTDCKSTAATI